MMKWLMVVTNRDGMPTDSVRDMVSQARLTMWWSLVERGLTFEGCCIFGQPVCFFPIVCLGTLDPALACPRKPSRGRQRHRCPLRTIGVHSFGSPVATVPPLWSRPHWLQVPHDKAARRFARTPLPFHPHFGQR